MVEEMQMRRTAFLLVTAVLVGCSTMAEQPMRTAKGQEQYQQLIAGKVAGPAQSCLPTIATKDMFIVDDETVAFKTGGNRVYVNRLRSGCSNLSSGVNSMITRQADASSLCRGDLAEVKNLTSGITVSSCLFGDFVPYTPGGV
jgi:hypothetical protein